MQFPIDPRRLQSIISDIVLEYEKSHGPASHNEKFAIEKAVDGFHQFVVENSPKAESAEKSDNKQMDEIQTDNIVKKILLIQSKLVGHTHINEIKEAFDDIEIIVSELHHL